MGLDLSAFADMVHEVQIAFEADMVLTVAYRPAALTLPMARASSVELMARSPRYLARLLVRWDLYETTGGPLLPITEATLQDLPWAVLYFIWQAIAADYTARYLRPVPPSLASPEDRLLRDLLDDVDWGEGDA